MRPRILIAEDDRKISRIIELLLLHEGYETVSVYDGKEALAKIKYDKFDLVLLDVMMPIMNGIEVCRRVREFSNIPIIIVSAKGEISDKVIGLDLGANDYLTKPFANEELLARIRAAIRSDKTKIQEEKLYCQDIEIDMKNFEVRVKGEKVELAKKEFELLEYLVRNSGIVLERDKILGDLWGFEFIGNDNILNVYIKYLRDKIERPFDIKVIHTVRGFGFTIKKG